MATTSTLRIGVDTGGTFTDCVILDGSGMRILKVFSTPDDPAQAIVGGVRQLVEAEREDVGGVRRGRLGVTGSTGRDGSPRALEIIHGTTVGTNTLLERKGARVALVTTAGFEDLIEIGRQNRPRLYDLDVRRQPPLVPRPLRFGVSERTAADATILQRPSRRDLHQLLARLRRSEAESLALSFLFAYANPANERAVTQALGKLGLPFSVSHEILPEFREYERLSTVVVNAYLAPRLGTYLTGLTRAFAETGEMPRGLRPVHISVMQSSGGITTAERAGHEPVRTILSGPAGGVVATAWLAQKLGIRRAISFDMGGTSTDVSLIDGAPRTTRESSIGELPVAVPVLDVHSVGAGGGSLARFDGGGALRVGPESAGAVPGPACYGRGGISPTVTDAHLLLGRLHPAHFLGGSFALDLKASQEALARLLKAPGPRIPRRMLPENPLELARGIVAVANATMERALRVISVERGHDPRDFNLVSFGGAGGLHAADLARALGMAQVIVPSNPGAFSAFGILVSDVVKDISQSVLLPVPGPLEARAQQDGRYRDSGRATAPRPDVWRRFLQQIERRFAHLEAQARVDLRREGQHAKAQAVRQLDVRYVGQSYEITVPFSRQFAMRFHREHERSYGYDQPNRPLEVVNLRVRLVIHTPKPAGRTTRSAHPSRRTPPRSAILTEGRVWFGDRLLTTPFYDRERLPAGTEFAGPAVALEYSSTTVVPPDYNCRVDADANLILTRLR
jgi:N-methylhydantoinase A